MISNQLQEGILLIFDIMYRCLFQLSREVQAILEELEVRFHFQKNV